MANEKLGVATEPWPESLQLRCFTFVPWSLTFWNLSKHHCFIVLDISIEGDLELCFGGDKLTKAPRRDCVAKLQLAF